jgi:hypothetical protein
MYSQPRYGRDSGTLLREVESRIETRMKVAILVINSGCPRDGDRGNAEILRDIHRLAALFRTYELS